jgi:hypothetical protein
MIVFTPAVRLALGLLVALLGYLVAGELHVSEELRGGIAALTLLLASVGVVPPKPGDVPKLSPQVRFLLTALATAGAYVVNTLGDIDPTLRGLVVAALALGASVGIVPPTARNAPPIA